MARLTLDPISARTLPALDSLVAADNFTKLNEVLGKTPREALLRLTLAALSRHRMAGGALPATAPAAVRTLEELVRLHLVGQGETVREFLVGVDDQTLAAILKHSLLRFKMLEGGR